MSLSALGSRGDRSVDSASGASRRVSVILARREIPIAYEDDTDAWKFKEIVST